MKSTGVTSNLIKDQLNQLPDSPGVYLFKDDEGSILYVGKAADLRQRVRSYFSTPQKLPPKLQRMVEQISDFEFFVTKSDPEALILECNLIKRFRPHFNVRLKDDKAFPYLKIDHSEEWPRVQFTRRLESDGAHYFGPFTSARSVRETLKVIRKIFPFRPCSKTITGTDSRPCLQYYLNRCLAPCIGVVTREEYDEVIRQVILFLEGKQETVIELLDSKMREAADDLNFEKAALIRDQIQAIKNVVEGQRIATTVSGEQDVIAYAPDRDQACVQVFFIRDGKLIGRESFILVGTAAEEPPQIMSSFIKQFYDSAPYIPPLLLLQHPVEDKDTIISWLKSKRGAKVAIEVPARGKKKQLVNTVAENAGQGLQQMKIKQLAAPSALNEALAEMARELCLPGLPSRIEGYDISNIQGKGAVGSMVVFDKGRPKPSHYRRFKIKAVSGANDYAMLQEVLRRRFKRSSLKRSDTSTPDAWATLPDLVLIDGGKGQLNAVLSVMDELGTGSVPVASLAKENEEVFIPQRKEPIVLPGSSPGLQLLQRVRDEAHRFALGYHQKVRRKETFGSLLDSIPGIGPRRKRALLRQFGSVQGIRNASIEELAAARGMTERLARKIKELL
jgi:excinuclease ABC subunit C